MMVSFNMGHQPTVSRKEIYVPLSHALYNIALLNLDSREVGRYASFASRSSSVIS